MFEVKITYINEDGITVTDIEKDNGTEKGIRDALKSMGKYKELIEVEVKDIRMKINCTFSKA